MADLMLSDKPRPIRIRHMRNMALFEARRDNRPEKWDLFHAICVRIGDELKDQWRTQVIDLKGFGGGAAYRYD